MASTARKHHDSPLPPPSGPSGGHHPRHAAAHIGDLAQIQAGFQFREQIKPDPHGNVYVLQIKDVPDRRRITPESRDRILFDKPVEPYLIRQDDVLFLSRGHKLFALAITEELKDTIAAGYFYILRLRDRRVSPTFLAWYLNQPAMQESLRQTAQGSHMPFISMTDFREVSIPLPPIETQKNIVALAELAEREQQLLATLATTRASLIQNLTHAAATGQTAAH